MTARVSADVAPLSGQLRVREVAGSDVVTHVEPFAVEPGEWQDVTLKFTTSSTAKFDLNLFGWGAGGQFGLLVDDISLSPAANPVPTPSPTPSLTPSPTPSVSPSPTPSVSPSPTPSVSPSPTPSVSPSPTPSVSPSPTPTLDPTPSPMPTPEPAARWHLTDGSTVSDRGIPDSGTLVGASIGGNDDPAEKEALFGATLGVHRTFYQANQVDYAMSEVAKDVTAGRVPWISFKAPYTWEEMAAGKGDAWARDIAERLDEIDSPVWLAIHHEPENDGDIEAWKAMQRRLSPIVRETADNVAYSIVVTGWNQFFGPAEYSMDNIWPGDGYVDLVGYDLYNFYGAEGGTVAPSQLDIDTAYLEPISEWATAHDVAWGLAELGYTHQASDEDPAWLTRAHDATVARGGVAFTYFDSTVSPNGPWELDHGAKSRMFGSLVRLAPQLDRR
ncbi:carbohydrate-binding protein CenC [Isoptericola jiangsuensis]|uniref:carbohydrate-binding protein CenC n=1 Tax=Isoptericola jiangsuensis TaxID=548579 RepID=UPI003AAFEB5F